MHVRYVCVSRTLHTRSVALLSFSRQPFGTNDNPIQHAAQVSLIFYPTGKLITGQFQFTPFFIEASPYNLMKDLRFDICCKRKILHVYFEGDLVFVCLDEWRQMKAIVTGCSELEDGFRYATFQFGYFAFGGGCS